MNTSKNRYYLRRLLLTPALLTVYPLLAFLVPHEGQSEFYPFFFWDLFSRSADNRSDSVILVKEINGRPLPKPTLFFDLSQHFASARRKEVRLGKLLNNLIRAERTGNQVLSEHLYQVIENTFMSDVDRVKYDVATIRYNPIQFYRFGTIEKTIVIGSREKEP